LSEGGAAAFREAVVSALDAVVAKMSTYLPDSELSWFNRHAARTPFAVSADVFNVFVLAQKVSAASRGAFDVTVAPVVDAWGFGPDKTHRVLATAELVALEERVGWRMLALDAEAGTVAKMRPEVRADLSGIAKGFGVDRAARALEALGIADYMVEAGGEVRTRGHNAEGRPWQIAIERPDAMPSQAHLIVPLSGQSMATSGDYRIYFEHDGQRYCHELDPRTGTPIRHRLASVSVVASDCGFADAMATALIVLGPEQGYALAAAQNIAAYFIMREPDGSFTDRHTSAFAELGVGASPVRNEHGGVVAAGDLRDHGRRVRRRHRRDGDRADGVGTLPTRVLRRVGSRHAGRRKPVLRDMPQSAPARTLTLREGCLSRRSKPGGGQTVRHARTPSASMSEPFPALITSPRERTT
jgi:thiamine biosynthesis lipoprotein